MAPKPERTTTCETEPAAAEERRAAAAALDAFLEFVETLDCDANGNHVCPEGRQAIEHLWAQVCESVNACRQRVLARTPIVEGFRRPDLMSADDVVEFRTLSNALFASALTRFTPDGVPWLDAVARSAEVPPVGLIVVEADRVRKLRTIKALIEPRAKVSALIEEYSELAARRRDDAAARWRSMARHERIDCLRAAFPTVIDLLTFVERREDDNTTSPGALLARRAPTIEMPEEYLILSARAGLSLSSLVNYAESVRWSLPALEDHAATAALLRTFDAEPHRSSLLDALADHYSLSKHQHALVDMLLLADRRAGTDGWACVDTRAIELAAERAVEKVACRFGDKVTEAGKTTHARTLVLWEGAEHTERNVRLARTRTAHLEAHGNVVDALAALKAAGHPVSRSTYYNHLDALDRAIPGWRASVQLSNPTGNPDGLRTVGTHGKSRGKPR